MNDSVLNIVQSLHGRMLSRENEKHNFKPIWKPWHKHCKTTDWSPAQEQEGQPWCPPQSSPRVTSPENCCAQILILWKGCWGKEGRAVKCYFSPRDRNKTQWVGHVFCLNLSTKACACGMQVPFQFWGCWLLELFTSKRQSFQGKQSTQCEL
jgi:hypothetical protein